MTREEWLSKCAARYQERGGLMKDEARGHALLCAEALDDIGELYLETDPTQAADDDLDCWENDE